MLAIGSEKWADLGTQGAGTMLLAKLFLSNDCLLLWAGAGTLYLPIHAAFSNRPSQSALHSAPFMTACILVREAPALGSISLTFLGID